jgi:L-2-amino-thiazoline-4-carboxylic acid hydrolase
MSQTSTSSSAHPEGLSMLEKRKIEAEILKEVYETLKESHGEEVARKTIAESVRRSAIEQARQFAAAAPGGTSLKAFQDVMPLWTKGGALEIEVKEQTDTTFTFNVVRCRYAETYKAMGLGEIGHLLSCNRDGAFCEGYDPKLKLERTQTIMQGASHCDFKYRYGD